MKNRRLAAVINLSIIALFVGAVVGLTVFAKNKYQAQVLPIIIFVIAGLVLHYALSLIFHEMGHTLFAKTCKMDIKQINFGLFSIDFSTKKIRWFTYFSSEAGEMLFSSFNEVSAKQIRLIAFGGLLFSFLYLIICYIPLLFVHELTLTCLLGIGGISAVYLFFVNILPIDKTSDGAILISRKQYPIIMSAIINHQKAVECGEIPSEQEVFKKSMQPLARYYHYLYLMLEGKKEEAHLIIRELSDIIDELTDEEYNLIFSEIIAINCLNNSLDEDLNARAEIYFDEEVESPAFLRAHYLYRKAQGENAWAEGLYASYLKTVESAPLLIKEVEKQFNF